MPLYVYEFRVYVCEKVKDTKDILKRLLGEVLKIINFVCSVLKSICPQMEYFPVLVKEKMFGVVNE